MCLDIVMEKHPRKDLFVGYKSYRVYLGKSKIVDYYSGLDYKYNTWYTASTNKNINISYDKLHKNKSYKSGFHIFINPIHAALYRGVEESAIVKVYFKPSDIMTIGMNECSNETLILQSRLNLEKYISPKYPINIEHELGYNHLRMTGATVISKMMYIPQQKPLIIYKDV